MSVEVNSNGVKISNKEIFCELREVHSKLDRLSNRVDNIFDLNDSRVKRIEKIEVKIEAVDRQMVFFAGGAALFGAVLPYLLGRLFG